MNRIPYYAVSDPFDVVYRNSSTSNIVLPHTHNAVEIYFTLTDLPDVLLNDKVSAVPKGSLIIIPPYNVHQLFNKRLTVYERYILSINSDWIRNIFGNHPEIMTYANRNSEPQILTLSTDIQKELIDTFSKLLKIENRFNINSYSEFFSLLECVDSIITDNMKHTHTSLHISKTQRTVNEIIAYVNEHITDSLTLEIIAEHFYMNKDYLNRLFKEHTHATISHYIALQRVSLAQALLSEGHSVLEVSECLNFSSYAYFFKFFKKMTGISPSQYGKLK